MWLNSQETVDLVTFTEEILNGKPQFLWSVIFKSYYNNCFENVWYSNKFQSVSLLVQSEDIWSF